MFTRSLNNNIRNSCFALVILFLGACGKGSDKPSPTPPVPEKAILSFPSENALCTSGTVISGQETKITFLWSKPANADSYELVLKNLQTNQIIRNNAATNQLTLALARNTPYSWSVVSRSKASSVTSETRAWKFYVAGTGVTNYSPFPAAAIAPSFGEQIKGAPAAVELKWSGNDVDNDITGFDVYFGNTTSPAFMKHSDTSSLPQVPVAAGNTYYWKVTSIDAAGNRSESELFQFTVL